MDHDGVHINLFYSDFLVVMLDVVAVEPDNYSPLDFNRKMAEAETNPEPENKTLLAEVSIIYSKHYCHRAYLKRLP